MHSGIQDCWIENARCAAAPRTVTGDADPVTVLTNGDAAPGVPEFLAESGWHLENEIGPLDLPAENVRAVEFGGRMQPVAATGRLRLVDGSALLVDRFQWAGNEVSAHHAIFGDLHLPARAVSELIFAPAPVRAPTVEEPKKAAKKDE